MMKETRLGKDVHCITCYARLDGCSSMFEDARPSAGDITVCIYCGTIMAFSKNRNLRALTKQEMREVAGDPRILRIQKARAAVMVKPR